MKCSICGGDRFGRVTCRPTATLIGFWTYWICPRCDCIRPEKGET